MAVQQKEILFVCVENAGRSQMAQAFAQKYGLKAESAGTVPASRINPIVVELMKEKGLDLSQNKPKMLTPAMVEKAGLVITMGCSVQEVCPGPMLVQMQKKLIDWNLPDPKGKSAEDVRRIRDDIEKRVGELSVDTSRYS
jgi:arsenate reductase (thioredoxin)